MPSPTSKVANRIVDGLKKFQPIVESAKIRDVNESDTVVILTGILSEVLGFDKYTDITTELSIRGTYCDLAIKINDKICFLLEAKAAGVELKEAHIKQAVDYAANKGIEWVVLSNAISWKVFKIIFSKPIQNILITEIDFLRLSHRNAEDVEAIFMLAKEAIAKSSLDECFIQKQATSKFVIGNLLLSDSVVSAVRKELKQVFPDIRVSADEISRVLRGDVLRREIVEGDEADEAVKKIEKVVRKKERAKAEKSAPEASEATADPVENQPQTT